MYKEKVKSTTALLLSLLMITCISCQKDEEAEDIEPTDQPDEEERPVEQDEPDEPNDLQGLNLPSIPYDYQVILPDHFLTNRFPSEFRFQNAIIDNDNTPSNNPTTNEGATLGRVLFYDTKLSANGTTSCASCHKQELAFSDDARQSTGFDGGLTRRHSMSLINSRFYQPGKFFWDERVATLEDQVLMPIQDPVEMGLTLQQLVDIVEDQPYYPILFRSTFGNDEVTTDRISKALAQFVRSIVSTNSKYDRGSRNASTPLENFSNFTRMENRGKELFMSTDATGTAITCINCHMSESFVSPTLFSADLTTGTQNIGLDRRSMDDFGVMETTDNPADAGKFKAASLRNIAVSAPYMHDGRFRNLRDVMDFYDRDIEPHANLNPLLKDERGNAINFNFSREEKDALVDFLNTLTDNDLLTDVKFSDPFRRERDEREDDRRDRR